MTEKDGNKHIIGIIGSPRKGGNTDILVNAVLNGAEEAGAVPEKICLGDLNILPCRGCDACKKIGKCLQNDDMHKLLEKLEKSKIWVFGTPVYWWGPTAQFKTFFDRFHGAKHVVKDRRIILVIPCENKSEKMAEFTIGMLECSLNFLKAEIVSKVVAPGVYNSGEIKKFPEKLEDAFKAGSKAVMNLND